jgi:hypothetical protein
MSKGLNNPKAFGTQDEPETPVITPTQLADGTDFPHSGLFKALNLGLRGNYATTGFNATAVTDNDITFAEGVVFRDHKKVVVNSGSTQTIVISGASANTYHLVVNATGTTNLTLRSGSSANVVPDYSDDDVIVALLKYTGNDPMQIQYLTVNKSSNSLSIARSNSGTYTEEGQITANASGGIDITTITSNSDIRITPNGTGKTVITNLEVNSMADADGDTQIQLEESADEDKIRFDTAGSERMIIDNAGLVGIGTSSPAAELHVYGTTNPEIRVQETGQSGYSALIGFADNYGALRVVNQTTDESTIQDFEPVSTGTGAQTTRFFRNANSGGTARFQILSPGSTTECTRIQAETKVLTHYGAATFNENGDSVDFRVEGDTDANLLFVDGSTDRVGIGTSAPSDKLSINGNVRVSNNIIVNADFDHNGTNVGFFGGAPSPKTSVSTLGVYAPHAPPSADAHVLTNEQRIIQLQGRLDDLITSLGNLGLV